jgi:ABC-2 type transport system ATP-binding protein
MPEAEIPARITEVIAQVNLEVKRDAMIRGLSRGMKQRLGIARAIIHRPKVMLLDEPASGLDPKARLDLRNLLLALRDQGATILISSHILTELEGFCTSIGIMEKGRIVRSGSIEEVTAAATSMRLVRLSWVGDPLATAQKKLQEILTTDPRVAEVNLAASVGTFRFGGAEEDLAPVLASLIAANVPVTSFGEVKQTVEELYMKLSTHEVM